ncbi:hypothetical protein EDC01DRAFT_619770 [Geopyxis carbonaria]|nr:hypothetical protein EDC01DRAFT_619770 [Geopyxis carbonaria]
MPPQLAAASFSLSRDTILRCVALRSLKQLGGGFCEVKRLYVVPKSRRLGPVQTALDMAKKQKYAHVRLDTLASMTSARKLYEDSGFKECEK